MVSVFTQYRKNYKGPSWDDFALNEYNRKRDYRLGRRSVEQQHQPWEWDSSESETADFDRNFATTSRETIVKSNKPHVTNHKGNLALKEARKNKKPLVNQAWRARLPEQDVNIGERVYKQSATQTIYSHRTDRKHRKRKQKKPAKSETKAVGQGLVNDRERQQERVPFVCYGWANNAAIEKKYTHNVRADPNDVYPASLRAVKRRELDILKKLEEDKKKVLLEREIIHEKFFNLSHIPPMFLSEYQSSYCNIGIG